MTLIEIMVALVITGLVIGAGYGALASMTDQRQHAEHIAVATLNAASVHRTIADWIGGAHLSPYGDIQFQGVTETLKRGLVNQRLALKDTSTTSDELTFLTSSPTPVSDAETVVRLYVNLSDSIPERGLIAELTALHHTAVSRWVILPQVTRLRMRYLTGAFASQSGGSRLSSDMMSRNPWLDTYVSGSILPMAVEMKLFVVAPDTLPAILSSPMLFPVRSGS
jgi:prepilin-type N-terminal cleavage/methylation domain-containing protein